LIYKSNRESDEDRVYFLIENLDFYYVQMIHFQRMTRWKILDLGAKNWRTMKDISFLLCLAIVIILITNYNLVNQTVSEYDLINEEDNSNAEIIFQLNTAITWIQLILNIIICIFSAIESYPISIRYRVQTGAKKIIILKKESGLHTNILVRIYQGFIGFVENQFKLELVQESYIR
jgi:hypothetical protein